MAAAIGAFITGFTRCRASTARASGAVLIAALGMALGELRRRVIGELYRRSVVAATAVAGLRSARRSDRSARLQRPSRSTRSSPSSSSRARRWARGRAASVRTRARRRPDSGATFARRLADRHASTSSVPRSPTSIENSQLTREISRRHPRDAAADAVGNRAPMIADPQPFASSAERARFNRLLEDSEIIRKRLGAHLRRWRAIATRRRCALCRCRCQSLDAIAAALRGGTRRSRRAGESIAEALERSGRRTCTTRVWKSICTMLSRRPHALISAAFQDSPPRPQPGPYVRNRVDWFSREALRFALVMGLRDGGSGVTSPRIAVTGFAMTSAIVLQARFSNDLLARLRAHCRNAVGAVIATLVLDAVRGHPHFEIAGILIAAGAAYLTFSPNYALFTVAITSFVVLVLGMRGLAGTTAIDVRVLDTLAGGALGMAGYLVLPTWERKPHAPSLADLLDAQRALLVAILQAYAAPTDDARARIERARTAVWKARTTAEASIDRTRHEPRRPHTISVERALRILAVTQRIGLSTLALESGIDLAMTQEQARSLSVFAKKADERAAKLAAALRVGRRMPADDRLKGALSEVSAPPFIADRLRAYADSLARLSRLVGAHSPSVPS